MANTVPKSPTGMFVNKRNNYAVVKWYPVTQDMDGNPVTVQQYNVYRTPNTNSKGYVLVKQVTTTDSLSNIDTIYVDTDIDMNEIYFYKVTCVNNLSQESIATIEDAGLYWGDLLDRNPELVETIIGRWDESLYDVELFD